MRSYVIDGLSPEQSQTLSQHLQAMDMHGSVEGLYWLPIPPDMRTSLQEEHEKSCGPHVFALEIEDDKVTLELLVRALNTLHCPCVSYAHAELRQHMMAYVDALLASLDITV